jgi:hypothetical protein
MRWCSMADSRAPRPWPWVVRCHRLKRQALRANAIWHHGCAGGAALATDGTRSKGSTSFTLQYVSPRCRSLASGGDGGSGLDSERNPLPVLASTMVTPVWCRSHLGGDSRYYFGIAGGAWMLMFDVGGGAMILCSSHCIGDGTLCLLACTLWGNGLWPQCHCSQKINKEIVTDEG